MRRSITVAAIAACSLLMLLWLPPWSGRLVDATQKWNQRVIVERSSQGAARLFRELVRANLVDLDTRSGSRIRTLDCDAIRRARSALEHNDDRNAVLTDLRDRLGRAPTPDEIRHAGGLMTRLCRTDTGLTVLEEVAAWNRGGRLVGVRDSAEPGGQHSNLAETWRFKAGPRDDMSLRLTPLGLKEPDALYVDADLQQIRQRLPPLGPWTLARLVAVGGDVLMERRLPASSAAGMTLQIIGEPRAIRLLDEDRRPITEADAALARMTSVVRAKARLRACRQILEQSLPDDLEGTRFAPVTSTYSLADPCPDTRDVLRRAASPPIVSVVHLRRDLFAGPEARRAAFLEITITPRRATAPALTRLGKVRWDKPSLEGLVPSDATRVHQEASLVLYCGRSEEIRGDISRHCTLDWQSPPENIASQASPPVTKEVAAARAKSAEFEVFTRPASGPDGQKQEGRRIARGSGAEAGDHERRWSSVEGERLGLTSWLGVSTADLASLGSRALAASRKSGQPLKLSVSIDASLQEKADALLRARIEQAHNHSEALLPQRNVGRQREAFEDRDIRPLRRAALVIMSADGDSAGEILASAVWPRIEPATLGGTERKALLTTATRLESAGLGYLSPLASRAWSDIDQLVQPGSTFKIASSIALLQAVADGEPGMAELVAGRPSAELAARFGVKTCDRMTASGKIKADCVEIGRPVFNVNNLPFDESARNLTHRCEERTRFHDRNAPVSYLGLRQALQRSSNIWFASMIAGKAGFSAKALAEAPQHPFATTLARVTSFDTKEVRNAPIALIEPTLVGDQRVPRTLAERVRADFVHGSILHRRGGDAYDISLSRAAYGQQVQASPVAVTALMASVAMGRRVDPTLTLAADRPKPTQVPLIERVSEDEATLLLNELRCGMRAVVEPNGTAAGLVMPALIPTMYAKTGTAQVAGTGLNTVWFAGYQGAELRDASAAPAKGRLAFACMITHAGNAAGGASVCAPLISRLLAEIRGITASIPNRTPRPVKKKASTKQQVGPRPITPRNGPLTPNQAKTQAP